MRGFLSIVFLFLFSTTLYGQDSKGPFQLDSVSRYKCLYDIGASFNSTVSFESYFTDVVLYQPTTPSDNYFCYDRDVYGTIDSVLFPRLDSTPNYFSVWNDNRIWSEFYMYFTQFDYPGLNYGQIWMLTPWFDGDRSRYCPQRSDFESHEQARKLLNFIEGDTEGLYFATREKSYYYDTYGDLKEYPDASMFIPENLLLRIGFHIDAETNQIIPVTSESINGRSVHFYWPVIWNDQGEPESPLTMRSIQQVYTIGYMGDTNLVGCVAKGDFHPPGAEPTNGQVGSSCESDYACVSFCCNAATGKCSEHDPEHELSCNKQPGQSCVADEFCQKQNVTHCFIVSTGIDPTGSDTCDLRCYNVPTYPTCEEGICRPVSVQSPPVFDSTNPNCEDAITTDEVDDILNSMTRAKYRQVSGEYTKLIKRILNL